MRAVLSIVLIALASPALAAHCPPGEFYRVHLRECVRDGSRLALAVEHRDSIKSVGFRHAVSVEKTDSGSSPPTDPPLLDSLGARWVHFAPRAVPVLTYGNPWGTLSLPEALLQRPPRG